MRKFLCEYSVPTSTLYVVQVRNLLYHPKLFEMYYNPSHPPRGLAEPIDRQMSHLSAKV
jgi:hypothetical protein